jgi:hypothetical protein
MKEVPPPPHLSYINEANIKEDIIRSQKWCYQMMMKGLVSSAQGNVITKLCSNEPSLSQFQLWSTASGTHTSTPTTSQQLLATCTTHAFNKRLARVSSHLRRSCVSKPVPFQFLCLSTSLVLWKWRSMWFCKLNTGGWWGGTPEPVWALWGSEKSLIPGRLSSL